MLQNHWFDLKLLRTTDKPVKNIGRNIMLNDQLLGYIDETAGDFEKISDTVWEYAELCLKEIKSSKLQMEYMEKAGFRITTPVANMQTAFIAECGSGKPILAILGENDALAGQSQCADVAEQRPVVPGATGHACGHNLLGTGSMEAACALKKYMEANNIKGTLRYYACPAEEGGGGKVYLTAAGAFDDVDAAVSWHPSCDNALDNSGLACVTVNFRFEGVAAHAAGEPWNGRSALDAAELTCTGVQYLREHMTTDARIHYAFLNAGGTAPNVVQHTAEVQFVVRAADGDYMEELYGRVCKVAEGAALMTGTRFREPYIVSAYKNFVRNNAMDDLIIRNFKAMLPLKYTQEELDYARAFQACGTRPDAETPVDYTFNDDKYKPARGSTDVADVSYVVPISQARVVSAAIGSVGHGWTTTAEGKSSLAHNGMHTAAKLLASCIADLFEDPELLRQVRADFDAERGGKKYHTIMPTDRIPGE
jgi:aminobenzoyl-glutamate utilization protein B